MDDSTTAMESPLPPAILRGLGDRSYDKRKAAALEVTSLIKVLNEHAEKEKIVNVINLLANEFARSRNVHHRKGGLIGLAAAAIGLGADIDPYLNHLIPQVLECFDDPESRVCYYACESLYNISKVARTNILRFFNQIFDGLCKLFAHVDVDVKNGANLLDRLVKDIVTETETFDIESFIPLLQKHIRRTKPYIRQLLVGWITVLDAVPDINMLDYLPDFLDGLFNMLSDGNREIKQAADNALADFLREIKEAEVVEFGPMVGILVHQCRSKERANRYTALVWVTEFVALGGSHLQLHYADLIGSVIHCISDAETEIATAAKNANCGLMDLVRTTAEPFELQRIIHSLTVELLSEYVTTRVACLHWIYMLHEKDAAKMNDFIGDLLPALLKTVSDTADEVVLINLQVLAHISLDSVQFSRVLNSLVQLFLEDRPLLETRGALVIRKLCSLLDSSSIYMALADILCEKDDLEFVGLMVQTLNLILLTAPELAPLRRSLKMSFQAEADEQHRRTFTALFRCWTHNAVATFSLCLLAQAYALSSALILKFAEVDITVGFLMQIDKLVQLLESPIFVQLRLHLLETHSRSHTDLLKSLYGLLMLLPQSQAYKTLSDRLSTVSSLHMHIGLTGGAQGADAGQVQGSDAAMRGLLSHFGETQEQHSTFRLAMLQQKSLLNASIQETSAAGGSSAVLVPN
ncbi:vacuolar protein 14 C-terminal Fig4p binding-domain-containing protein [Ochromonadaceae sp. CCMP2298]|nr:vacuolar protein 14 C-terminal Fig4p binding-domain-containing protein [Ochromonadaceae sp. CCMP2298]|mmetsp:Transcript_21057/g.46778  ORF Transcript_21057/g.46778 Transcript_21057/m.46778 type:complete len:693 (-) Transcript_21057:161-2239(-)